MFYFMQVSYLLSLVTVSSCNYHCNWESADLWRLDLFPLCDYLSASVYYH